MPPNRSLTDDDVAALVEALRPVIRAEVEAVVSKIAPRKPRAPSRRLPRDPASAIRAAEEIATPTPLSDARAERALRNLRALRR